MTHIDQCLEDIGRLAFKVGYLEQAMRQIVDVKGKLADAKEIAKLALENVDAAYERAQTAAKPIAPTLVRP